MKKILVFVLIFGLIGAFIFPLFFSDDTTDETKFQFQFNENLLVTLGQSVTIPFEIINAVQSIDLLVNGERLKTWNHPKGIIKFTFDTKNRLVGSYSLELVAKLSDGSELRDERYMSILSDIVPAKWSLKILNNSPHLETSFTQGLAFDSGKLYEGTGDPNQTGATLIAEVDIESGQIKRNIGLAAPYFGEGITIFGEDLYQLTWKNQKCLVYDKKTFVSKKEFTYTGEGWGLCNDGKNLIMSDGSQRLYFRDPKTFQLIKTIEVYSDQGPINYLNELEYIEGLVYANIWMANSIAVIDPLSGKTMAIINADELVNLQKQGINGNVLNGIAYNSTNKKLYLTGKYWSKLFEVQISK
jgi:glutamine cyclotransferase